ncbi:MAG: NAD(P)/FAD-dependent oxidoreductase [Chloroflexota bacterium]
MALDDVLVVGAGPAGSHIAGDLARRGYRVKVLEEHDAPGEAVCCTGIVGSECFRRLSKTGVKVLREARSAVFYSPTGKSIRLEKETPQAYVLDRLSLDQSLAREAEGHGAEYVFGCHVEDISTVDGHVQVRSLYEGKSSVLKARSLVAACGFNPGWISRLGLGPVDDFAVAAQTEVETTVSEVEIRFSRGLAPGFFSWLVPTADGMGLAGLITRERPGHYLRKFLSQLALEGKVSSFSVGIKYGKVPLRPPRRSYGKGILVVGDAAGQVKPTTGGGIYYGLLCGDIASEVLDGALRCGDLSERRLSEYDRRWRQVLGRELKTGYLSRLLFERLSDRDIDNLFDVVKAHSLDAMALSMTGFSFDWHGDILRRALKHRGVRQVMGSLLMSVLSRQGHALRSTG